MRGWRTWARRGLALLAASLVAFLLSSIAQSLFVQQALRGVGARIPPGLALETMGRDLLGLLPTLAPLVALALAVGLSVAGLVLRVLPQLAAAAWPAAGFLALATAFLAAQLVLGVAPFAGARSAAGLVAMSLGGAAGGWLFGRLLRGSGG